MAFEVKPFLLVCPRCQLQLLKHLVPQLHYVVYKLGSYDKQYGIKIIVDYN
jgi:hypothetical protein